MQDLVQSIAAVRDSVCAILRVQAGEQEDWQKGRDGSVQTGIHFVGTAWCVVENRFFVTAYHVLNDEQPRNPEDRFFIFAVPQNGLVQYQYPVIGFPLEDPSCDMAILEINFFPRAITPIRAVPVTFRPQPDGTPVFTYGFPSPVITKARVDGRGNWLGGETVLRSHASQGIVAGQFKETDGRLVYEFSSGWHQGESGGPIFTLNPIAAFAVMQGRRMLQSAYGTLPGPHAGCSIAAIESKLRRLGASVV